MRLLTIALAVVAVQMFAGSPAAAHGAWIAERWGELAVIYGHGAGDDPYDPGKISRIDALDESGAKIAVTVNRAKNHATLTPAAEPAVMILEFDNGFWSKDAAGKWHNKPKSEVEGAVEGGRYLKNNVTLLHMHGSMPALPRQPLQIVPLANPTGLKAGDKLKIRVLFEGAPLAGAEITPDYVNRSGKTAGRTDANGELEIELGNDGLNVIAVSHTVPLADDPQADEVGYTATLSFVAADHIDE